MLAGCALPPVRTGSGSASGSVPVTQGPTQSAPHADDDYRRIEREVVAELNAARANPAAYAANLSALLPLFSGTLFRRPGAPAPIRTQEGPAAVREAINALNRQPALGSLSLSSALSNAARDLATDQARTGALGHTGSDGSSPATRITRYGRWNTAYNENVDYGPLVSGRDVVVDLLVDDGVPDRGHRKNIFDPNVHVVGVACGPHPKYGAVCVIDQVGGFTPK